jgi:hypothetical protein
MPPEAEAEAEAEEEEEEEVPSVESVTDTETDVKVPEIPKEEEKPAADEAPKPKAVRRKRVVAPAAAAEPPAPKQEILYFFSKEPENKEFSNFYETTFKLDGVEYKSAEHAFEAIKAKTFGDDEMFGKILKAKSAQSAKSFGNKVKNFKEETWAEKQDEVMTSVLRAKFTQNLELRKKLLDTGDKLLANADPRDKYWGISTSASTEVAKTPTKWKGDNKLGKILEALRTELRAEKVEPKP